MLIRRSKTDQSGEGAEIVIPRGLRIRPVEAVQTWLQAAGIVEGLLFRASTGAATCVVMVSVGTTWRSSSRGWPRRRGSTQHSSAGTSLRGGFVTSAAETGAMIFKIAEVSRHKSTDVLSGYVRRVDLFKDHAAAGFL